MALDAQLQALSVPAGTEFPGTVQQLLILIAQYEEITGLESFSGINFGPTEPTAENRDKPWFKTDGSGNPIGWLSWGGSAWESIPIVTPSGATSDRPVAPSEGTQYFDTTIGVALIYHSGAWTTMSGSPGDIKQVTGTTLATVLTANPGWSQYTDGIGRVLAGAAADGSDVETDVGEDVNVLTVDQLPAHTHSDIVFTGSSADNGDPGTLIVTAATENNGTHTNPNSLTGSTGAGADVENRQKTRYVFTLVKD
jgi:hypothetical protein